MNSKFGDTHVEHLRELDQPGGYRRRIAEWRRPHSWNESMILGDYHLPFGKAEAQANAAKWIWQI